MANFKDKHVVDETRQRLYDRGHNIEMSKATPLTATESKVPKAWSQTTNKKAGDVIIDPRGDNGGAENLTVVEEGSTKKKGWSYRSIILVATTVFFILAAGLSSLYLYLGGNQVSGRNIEIAINGPFTVSGGEAVPLQVKVTNNNRSAVESATVIVQYPAGARAADGSNQERLEERHRIEKIEPGETIELPFSVVIFGEENQERVIKATIEYRHAGSNGTFFREAEPLAFRINSSPINITVRAIEKVSAGQEVSVMVTLVSNASVPLRDILLSTEYPANFNYTKSSPSPTYRDNHWLIKELRANEPVTIELSGQVRGGQSEEFQLQFTAGTPAPDNQFAMGSVLASARTDFIIERPFVEVTTQVNNRQAEVATLRVGESASVSVTVTNTLTETLYDLSLEVGLEGNVLMSENVSARNGYYDSNRNVIRWEVSGNNNLAQVSPGSSRTFNFTVRAGDETRTPSFVVKANTFARRVSEPRATEQLIGNAQVEVRYTSSVAINREVSRAESFPQTGPVPPVANQETTYSVILVASAGGNDVTGTVVNTSIPQYVNWKNQVQGDGNIVFNPVSKEVTWNAGDIKAGEQKRVIFQVGLLPSVSQIGTTPALLGTQRLRATDRFTSEVIRAEAVPISAELPAGAGHGSENGRVQGGS